MEPIITWKDFQKTMPWEIVILVGGGYALASGSKVTLESSYQAKNFSLCKLCKARVFMVLGGKIQRY